MDGQFLIFWRYQKRQKAKDTRERGCRPRGYRADYITLRNKAKSALKLADTQIFGVRKIFVNSKCPPFTKYLRMI